MPVSSARAPQPNKRKGRAGGAARPSLNSHNISATSNSIAALRLQRLFDVGIIGCRADLIASLVWEVDHG